MKELSIENLQTVLYCPKVSDEVKLKAIHEYKELKKFAYESEKQVKELTAKLNNL